MSPTTSTGSRGVPGDPHVHDVGAPQIDLGGTARPLTDHRVIRAPQLGEAVQRRCREAAACRPAVVAARTQLADRLAHQHDLTALLAAGLEQHGIHQRGRLDPAGLRLHGLSPPDLGALPGDERVERHVLRLEGRDLDALPHQPPADPGGDDALAGVGGGTGDEQTPTAHAVRPFTMRPRGDTDAEREQSDAPREPYGPLDVGHADGRAPPGSAPAGARPAPRTTGSRRAVPPAPRRTRPPRDRRWGSDARRRRRARPVRRPADRHRRPSPVRRSAAPPASPPTSSSRAEAHP